jgi:pyoverdine/dityrosine biosynthesis protein Dit1
MRFVMPAGDSTAMSVATQPGNADLTVDFLLRLLLPYRRAAERGETRPDRYRVRFAPQLASIAGFVQTGRPILFTLPAFPCKSPNRRKVLGHLPDLGELLSLRFLDQLCRQVGRFYDPGARLLVCSDGHVFGDHIGVPDRHVDEYGAALAAMIDREGLEHIDTYSLADAYPGLSHDQRRERLTAEFAQSTDSLRDEVRSDEDTLRLYRGITRFLVEDAEDGTGSRAARQREARQRAYGVIQRSRAWGSLIADRFPESVRLSIHPQLSGSAKFGIMLLESPDSWMTPWHSVAILRSDGRFTLMKRVDAERIGQVVVRDGRPSHYVVTSA